MAPFLLLETGTIPAYGLTGWLDIWNGLDLLTYFIQAGRRHRWCRAYCCRWCRCRCRCCPAADGQQQRHSPCRRLPVLQRKAGCQVLVQRC